MKITLRKRLKGDKISLYLDYYHKGKREYEYLNLYLTPEPKKGSLPKSVKTENTKTLELAESIRAKRFLAIQHEEYGFRDKEKAKGSFINYFDKLTEMKKDSLGNYGNWNSVRIILKEHNPKDITFDRLNKDWVQSFKDYLDKSVKTKTGEGLSLNSKYSYFNKLRAALKQAVKDGLLKYNPSEQVTPFPQDEPQREFLTLDELKKLAQTPCKNSTLRRMFIFSCLTGLRWSDIEKLKWSEIQHSTEMGNYIRFRQKKTNGVETLPISAEARELLEEQGKPDDKIFTGFSYGNWNKTLLKDWLIDAGITKHITFHCARHTYATLQLTLGTDIYTVSKLLGHRHLKTTEVYAKVIDDKKKDAANRIKIEL
jgi:integrase